MGRVAIGLDGHGRELYVLVVAVQRLGRGGRLPAQLARLGGARAEGPGEGAGLPAAAAALGVFALLPDVAAQAAELFPARAAVADDAARLLLLRCVRLLGAVLG